MKIGQALGDLLYMRAGKRTCADRSQQRVRLLEAAHHDRVLHGIGGLLRREAKRSGAVEYRAHPEIDAGSKLTVDGHLLTARRAPARERAVVEEREPHRLLDLVGTLAGNEHPRGMGLVHLHRRVPWIHRRIAQGLHD